MRFEVTIQNRLTGRHRKSFVFVGAETIRNKDILDIGCDYGWFENWAIKNKCKRVIGLEPRAIDLENAQEEVPSAKYLKGSALEIPLDNESVDVVVMWEVLEHLPEDTEERAFSEINRVLKGRGRLYLSTPNSTFWSCLLDPAWWLIGHRHYSSRELEKLAEDSGFEIGKVDYGGGFWELYSMILLYIFKWVFRSEIPFKDWLEQHRDKEFTSEGTKRKAQFATVFIAMRKLKD